MRKLRATLWCVLAAAGTAGCHTITPVPGSESVKTTVHPADVVGCTALGDVSISKEAKQHSLNPVQQALNEVVGLGGNVLLVTHEFSGVAYSCGSSKAPTTPAAH